MPTCRAVIISAFGSGNLPVKEESGVLQALEAAVKRGILVVVISGCEWEPYRASCGMFGADS